MTPELQPALDSTQMDEPDKPAPFQGKAPRAPRLTALAITSCVSLAYVILFQNAHGASQQADAYEYWLIGHLYFTPSGLSNPRPVELLRGYSYPVFLGLIQQLAATLHLSGLLLFRICSALLFSVLFAVLVPTFMHQVFGTRLTTRSGVALAVSGMILFRGHIVYSLSDLPALTAMLAAAVLLASLPDRLGDRRLRFQLLGLSAATGALLAVAANTRPVYELSLICGLIYLIFMVLKTRGPSFGRVSTLTIMPFLVGTILVLAPQSLINHRNLGTLSPFGQSHAEPGQPSLYVQQLYWGISIQRYETNLSQRGSFPVEVMFIDPRGNAIAGIRGSNTDPRAYAHAHPGSPSKFLNLMAHHPSFFALTWARHTFNGLDPVAPTAYPDDIAPRSALFATFNYLLMAVAFLRASLMYYNTRQRPQMMKLLLVGMILGPAIITIPTAMESRFMLPLQMLIIGFAVLPHPNVKLGNLRPISRVASIGVLLAVPALCFLLATNTYAHVFGVQGHYSTWCITDC